MRYGLVIFSFLLGFAGWSAALAAADNDIGEGYASPTFKELSQTVVLLGGVDINKTKVADEYGRLVYCGEYQENFKNDFEWSKIRNQIVSRVLEKKEYFRVLYEITAIFKLGRYDSRSKSFPLSPDTAMVNVGSMLIFSGKDYKLYCGIGYGSPAFPSNITMVLDPPLTLKGFKFPEDGAEKLIARMLEKENSGRQIYGRIRLRITDVLKPVTIESAKLRGAITAIDLFLDEDMTQLVSSVPLGK